MAGDLFPPATSLFSISPLYYAVKQLRLCLLLSSALLVYPASTPHLTLLLHSLACVHVLCLSTRSIWMCFCCVLMNYLKRLGDSIILVF